MIDRILLYVTTLVMTGLVAYGFIAHQKVKSLNITVYNLGIELEQAKQDIRLKTFEATHNEKKERTDEDINATLNNNTPVSDGNYTI